MAQSFKHLPSAQVMILGFWDGALFLAPYSGGNLLLPFPPLLIISLSVSLPFSHYQIKSLKNVLKGICQH